MSSPESLPNQPQNPNLAELQKKKRKLLQGRVGAVLLFATSGYLSSAAPLDVNESLNEHNDLKALLFETSGLITAAITATSLFTINYLQKELDVVDEKINDLNKPKRI